jgi:tRNA nucleotidyltransferase (CCA-adding enzyme)
MQGKHEMPNLAGEINTKLPPDLTSFLKLAGETASNLGYSVYLVGGTVRDLLLSQANLDIDLAVEGDAITLARKLTDNHPSKITTHPRFGTATILLTGSRIDLSTSRRETYSEPGALPTVRPGSIEDDLFRRDFTINAMAVNLKPGNYGELVDPYGGKGDLKDGLIRVLHDRSFTDDATRILRGLRFKERLGFKIEPATLSLLKRDIPRLDTISGDRIRHELEHIFDEKEPERVCRLAGELGVLQRLHPALKFDGWLANRFKQARQIAVPKSPVPDLYLALLTYRLNRETIEQLINHLRLSKALALTLRDTASLRENLKALGNPGLAPSRVYHHLRGYMVTAITANLLASDSAIAREHIQLYLNKLRYVKPALTGDDLVKTGISPGPRIKEILEKLHDARLDGKVSSKEDELKMVRELFFI